MEPAFYTTLELDAVADGGCSASLQLDPAHPIFEGHFPGMPVLPGVCMIRMVRETLERRHGKPFRLLTARSIKFLNMLNPNENPTLRLTLNTRPEDQGALGVDGTLTGISGEPVFFKINAIYLPEPQ